MDFPGGPKVKTLHFHCRGQDSIPQQGTKMPCSMAQKRDDCKGFIMGKSIWIKDMT